MHLNLIISKIHFQISSNFNQNPEVKSDFDIHYWPPRIEQLRSQSSFMEISMLSLYSYKSHKFPNRRVFVHLSTPLLSQASGNLQELHASITWPGF